jgi:hypothetical protein
MVSVEAMAGSGKTTEPQTPPRRNRAHPIVEGARTESAPAFGRAGFRDATLVLRWDDIAGPETARIARPIKFSEGPQGGVLTLKAEPGAALFLQHESRALIERVNAFLGRPAVARLRFVQGPLVRRSQPVKRPARISEVLPDDPAVSFHGPESIRAALLKLARRRRRPAD